MSPLIQEQFAILDLATVYITCHFEFSCCSNLTWTGPALDSLTASERVFIEPRYRTQSWLTIERLVSEDELRPVLLYL